ncbi:hypothetical protein F5I97DRAFT_1837770 [Phlebopus sp. FC_14]|nr:hypothetical protein F5I97DRAFT_1837770 [Phlebopus sp. FC_14]
MDNPWASSSEPSEPRKPWAPAQGRYQEADIGLSSWSTDNAAPWTSPALLSSTPWTSETADENASSSSTDEQSSVSHPAERDAAVHDQLDTMPPLSRSDSVLNTSLPTDRSSPFSTTSFCENTATPGSIAVGPGVSASDQDTDTWADSTMLVAADDQWAPAWSNTASLESDGGNVHEAHPPDVWGSTPQENDKLDATVLPPELLASIMQRCQQVSDEIWPESDMNTGLSEEDWRSGFDGLENIAKLLNELVPQDLTLPPPAQFPTSATASAMKEALKSTRLLPLTGNSPLARLFASKGSLNWEKSVKSMQESTQDPAPVGWRVLEKEYPHDSSDSKPKKAGAGLLSFWNRRVSSNPVAATTERSSERSSSPVVTSIENVKSTVQPQASRDASPTKPSAGSTAVRPVNSQSGHAAAEVTVPVTVAAPSAVSRFLNRFSRSQRSSHNSLALSPDDLEYLSDIVPSANDPDDSRVEATSNDLFNMMKPSTLPPKLPPPLTPPSRALSTSRPSSVIGPGLSDKRSSTTLAPQSGHSNIFLPPKLPPPLTPSLATSQLHPHSPSIHSTNTTPRLSLSILASPMPTSVSSAPTRSSAPPQPSSRPQSPFSLPAPPKSPTSHSIPPLLPPPMPPSRSQTPRASAIPPISSAASDSVRKPFKDSDYGYVGSDEEFSAFTSPTRSSPPSPPPRRSYHPTHGPSPSTSSILSPASQHSEDRLYSARSSISASFDDFDDFVTSSTRAAASPQGGIRTPSPPPLPSKHTSPHSNTSRIVNTSSNVSVRLFDHQRTQSLVDHAAAQRGQWPNSPVVGPPAKPIPSPPPTDNLLGDLVDVASPPPPPLMSPFTTPQKTGGRIGVEGMQRSSSSPPSRIFMLPHSFPIGASAPAVNSLKLSQPVKPTQTGGLSAQDLSFFEGL